jgi:hypothetical protein
MILTQRIQVPLLNCPTCRKELGRLEEPSNQELLASGMLAIVTGVMKSTIDIADISPVLSSIVERSEKSHTHHELRDGIGPRKLN